MTLTLGKAAASSHGAPGGTCESCHYIDGDGNLQRWDYAKYDLYKGYTDIAADDEAAQI